MKSKDTEVSLKDLVEQDLPKVLVEASNIIFLDISSACTGYSIFSVDFTTRKATALSAGAIWFPDGDHQEKYAYLFNAIVSYFNIVEKIDYIVAEQYSINPDKRTGCMVGPEMHGVLKVAAAEIGCKVRVFPPQSWRSELGIKKTADRDFKEPTKQKILQYVNIPESIQSNITHNERKTPSDLFDAIALGLGFMKRINIQKFDFSKLELQKHVGVLNV